MHPWTSWDVLHELVASYIPAASEQSRAPVSRPVSEQSTVPDETGDE